MSIPEEILSVPRPKNSIVICYGKNKDRYAVRKRIGNKRKNGKNYPVNGPTIGHIIDGKYVPIEEKRNEKVLESGVDIKDWGLAAECDKVFSYMLKELDVVYSKEDSLRLYCIALLRVMYPGIKDHELEKFYEASYLSELYPNVDLSKNTVTTFLENVGRAYSKMVKFMRNRVEKLGRKSHILIDSVIKNNNSKITSLSDFSRKTKINESEEILVVYSFNLEMMEPVTAKCYFDVMPDPTIYSDFIEEFEIKTGFLVSSKPCSRKFKEEYPELYMLYPLTDGSSQVETYKMFHFDSILPDFDGITYKKVSYEAGNGKRYYLYSFRNVEEAAKEDQDWLERARIEEIYSYKAYEKESKAFGTIVLESNLDLSPEVAYKAYNDRWIIDIVMRYYKSGLSTEISECSDYIIIGSEFVDFLSTICTFRLLKDFDSHKLLEDNTYIEVVDTLRRVKRVRVGDKGEWENSKMNPTQLKMLIELELLPKPEETKRKRGRPKGSKNKKKES